MKERFDFLRVASCPLWLMLLLGHVERGGNMFGISHIFEIWVFVGLGVMVILFLMSAHGQALPQSRPA